MLKVTGEIRRMRAKIINRGEELEALGKDDLENAAYIRGLEFALAAIDKEIE